VAALATASAAEVLKFALLWPYKTNASAIADQVAAWRSSRILSAAGLASHVSDRRSKLVSKSRFVEACS
jgi:hypothetical protein